MYLKTEQELRDLYGFAKGRSVEKELNALEKHSINFIAHSPFVAVSTYGVSGTVDCSPRGGEPGFIKVLNEHQIIIPDAKGNNRLDSLVNIIETGKIGCLFLIPGVNETLRINGLAKISTAPEHIDLFKQNTRSPQSCLEITVQELYLHCAKALMRSKLWSPDTLIKRDNFPSMGQMINDQLSISEIPESQQDMEDRYRKDL